MSEVIEIIQTISVIPSQLFNTLTGAVSWASEEEHLWQELSRDASDIKCARIPLAIAHKFKTWPLCDTHYELIYPRNGNYAIILSKEDYVKSALAKRRAHEDSQQYRALSYATLSRINRIMVMVERIRIRMELEKGWTASMRQGALAAYGQGGEDALRELLARFETMFSCTVYEEPSGDELMIPPPSPSFSPTITTITIEQITDDTQEEANPDKEIQ